ncbi:hypothetical protein ONZ45_g13697 [Pleurotus djamor]|nr:hypothetical protein ONZ45_g13697 [Pleurotus djamor]
MREIQVQKARAKETTQPIASTSSTSEPIAGKTKSITLRTREPVFSILPGASTPSKATLRMMGGKSSEKGKGKTQMSTIWEQAAASASEAMPANVRGPIADAYRGAAFLKTYSAQRQLLESSSVESASSSQVVIPPTQPSGSSRPPADSAQPSTSTSDSARPPTDSAQPSTLTSTWVETQIVVEPTPPVSAQSSAPAPSETWTQILESGLRDQSVLPSSSSSSSSSSRIHSSNQSPSLAPQTSPQMSDLLSPLPMNSLSLGSNADSMEVDEPPPPYVAGPPQNLTRQAIPHLTPPRARETKRRRTNDDASSSQSEVPSSTQDTDENPFLDNTTRFVPPRTRQPPPPQPRTRRSTRAPNSPTRPRHRRNSSRTALADAMVEDLEAELANVVETDDEDDGDGDVDMSGPSNVSTPSHAPPPLQSRLTAQPGDRRVAVNLPSFHPNVQNPRGRGNRVVKTYARRKKD